MSYKKKLISIEETRNTRIVMNMIEILNCALLWGGSVCADAKECVCENIYFSFSESFG